MGDDWIGGFRRPGECSTEGGRVDDKWKLKTIRNRVV